MTNEPPPLDMREAAIALHEYYESLLAAGFTRSEALYLVAQVLLGRERGDTGPPMTGT